MNLKLYALIALAMGLSGTMLGQTLPSWKPCTDVTDQFSKQVAEFNAAHASVDELSILLSCSYRGNPHIKRKPERHIPLTVDESKRLNELRKASTAAYETQEAYETYLFRTHHVKKLELGDVCYNFVGFVLDNDYITFDPNPMLAGEEECKY